MSNGSSKKTLGLCYNKHTVICYNHHLGVRLELKKTESQGNRKGIRKVGVYISSSKVI